MSDKQHTLAEARRQLMAAQRLDAAMRAHDSLMDYAKFTSPDPKFPEDAAKSRYQETSHGRLLCQIVEKIERRELKRVCVSIGPQFGKSELLSRKGPAWISGRDPFANLILASYNAPNAKLLLETMAHEMAHHVLKIRGHRGWAAHGKAFQKLAHQICRSHGFSYEDFV